MAETVLVDLSPALRAIDVVNSNLVVVANNVETLGSQIDSVASEQADIRQRLEQLYEEFSEYVEKDLWANTASKAREELTLIRQELESKFGHFAEVRRHATGILQAVDVAIVREGAIHTAVEKLMLTCPNYWLAPALVGLSAWISDNRPLAEKAVAEGLRRDDSKISLFFSLVCRRAGRMEACVQWLTRYFQNQNPLALDREVVVMLDALANGVFGGAALTVCSKVIDDWLAELEQQASFNDEQRERWAKALDAMSPTIDTSEYTTLRQYSSTWPQFEATLSAVRRNQQVQSFFEQLFTGELEVDHSFQLAVDKLLDSLVTNFDDEELPLRRAELFNLIVIEVDGRGGGPRGKRAEVDRLYQAEIESLDEQSNFAAMLTNSAMYPERYGATRATQRYAVSRSRQWIIAGFNDLTARDRARVPTEAEIACGSWKGISQDGLNESQLRADLQQHYASRIEQAVDAVGITTGTWATVGIGALFGVLIASTSVLMGLLIMLAVGTYFFFQYKNLENIRKQVRQKLEKERDDADRIMMAALAELADLRREITKEDARADLVVKILAALSSPQFVLKRPGQARAVQTKE
jgi:hypothetical protein